MKPVRSNKRGRKEKKMRKKEGQWK
uniref:Uncharacterized protein n=1 Tax=Arundo donax TaxID=35708 RepID=A0A0A8ZD22_ARUDO